MKMFFPLILMTFFAAVHFIAYRRIFLRLHLNDRSKRYLKYVLLLNYLLLGGYVAARYMVSIPSWLYFLFSLSIGIGFVLFMGWLMYEFLHLIQRFAPFDRKKREFFKRTTDAGFLSLGSAYIGAAVYEGGKTPVVKPVSIEQQRFGGKVYNVVQISDMHIGGLIDRPFVRQSVEMVNRLEPDIVAITGDLTDMAIEEIEGAVDELKGIKSRLGVYYVPGNHEYFHGIENTLEYLESMGIRVLRNEAVKVEEVWIVGVYDVFGYRYGTHMPDIVKATRHIPADAHTLLLAHQPRFIDDLDRFKPSLMLSGHTHGGQIWPFNHLVKLSQPYVKGLHALGEQSHIYVNSGIGFWGPPMRLGSQAEITSIYWS